MLGGHRGGLRANLIPRFSHFSLKIALTQPPRANTIALTVTHDTTNGGDISLGGRSSALGGRSSALGGLTVADLSGGLAAALCSMFLADNGARVVRVVLDDEDAVRNPPVFALYDRGKEVVRIDGADGGGADALGAILADADVLLEDFPPSSPTRARLGLDAAGARRAGLVHCSITAYGAAGPLADEPADHDLVAARTGILASQPSRRGDGPIHVVHPVAYVGAGLLAALGVAAALYRRERTGRGARVETSLMAGALLYAPKVAGANVPVRRVNMTTQGGGPFYSVFECADGEWIQLGCIHSGFVDIAAAALGVAEFIASNPEMGDGRWPRDEEARRRLFAKVAERIRTRSAAEWIAELQAADVPCDRAQTAREAMSDPQILHNGLVRELDDPLFGKTLMTGAPINLSETPPKIGLARAEKAVRPEELDLAKPARAPEAESPQDGDSGGNPPLSGVRVMEMTNVIAGPVAGRLLADLGADMIKFESPFGDISRPGGGAGFISYNAGKRSVSVDTKTRAGAEVARRLAASADLILANMRPGATERMGLSADFLREANPRIVQTHITAYGWDGPYAQRPGVDPIAQALTGLQRAQGGAGGAPVYLSALAPCDYTGGALGALGAVLGLLARERFGIGQKADTNLLAAGALMNADGFIHYDGKTPRPLPDANQFGLGARRRLYRTSDGWIYLAADAPAQDAAAAAFLDGAEDALAGMSTAAALDALSARGLPCAPVVEYYARGFFHDPQASANGMIAELTHPALGALKLSGSLMSFDGVGTLPKRHTPLLGEHTAEVLAELGYDRERIAALYEDGAVKTEFSV